MENDIPPGSDNSLSTEGPSNAHLLVGLAIMLTGAAMLADRLDVGWFHISGRWWPLLPLFAGLSRVSIAHCRNGRGRRSGLGLVTIGVWGIISEAELFGLTYATSWPLLIIGAGASIVWRAIDNTPRARSFRRI